MMHRFILLQLVLSIVLSGLSSGCSQVQRVFYRVDRDGATTQRRDSISRRFVLAAYQAPPQATQADPSQTGRDLQGTTSQPATSQPAGRVAYTMPGPAFRQIGVAVTAMTLGLTAETAGAGREASEANSFSFAGVAPLGRAGLTAPATVIGNSVVSRGGLQRGSILGLGFVNRDRNIFTRQVNPATGPNGRCQDLVRAGFFGSRGTCERHFGR
ncbi:MAG: hypothetical protein ACE5GE_17220 [Phycisphaerae bacterium]